MAFNRFGLIEAIRNLCDDLDTKHNTTVRFITNIETIKLTNFEQLNIFRIIQELTNNAIKHANATTITVQLLEDEEGRMITVEDNGYGFDLITVEQKKTTAFHSVRSRCQSLNGNLHIESAIGDGTMVVVEFK